MSVSDLSFSASLAPFNNTSGFTNNFSNTNLSVSGNVSVASGKDSGSSTANPTVLSSVTANGENFSESSATFNGSLLTVNYLASNVNNGVTDPSNVNINGNGISFSPQGVTAHGSTHTTTYSTSPNANFSERIGGAAISTGNSTDSQNITLKSLSLVGNSLVATYQVTDGALPNQTDQAPNAAPADSAVISVSSPSAVNNTGPSFSSRGVSTIGDLLASANGLNINGTLTGALQQPPSARQANDDPNANALLAATLNPNLNLSPSTTLQVTDFINTSLDAFPTSAPAAPADNSNNTNNSQNGNSGNNTFSGGNASPTYGSHSSNQTSGLGNSFDYNSSSASAAASVGIYSAISNANASTIRGTGVNTVA